MAIARWDCYVGQIAQVAGTVYGLENTEDLGALESMEETLVLVKPDGVKRCLIGEIICRFERKGLKIRGLRMIKFDSELADRHYGEHIGKPFFKDLKTFIMSGPVVAVVVAGDRAIEVVRGMIGATKFFDAAPGTIRGD